jgi:hypothetical protein
MRKLRQTEFAGVEELLYRNVSARRKKQFIAPLLNTMNKNPVL